MKIRVSALLLFTLLTGAVLLSGCSDNFAPMALKDDAEVAQTPIGEINGSVHGGQAPVTGAQIYLFAAGTTGYASASTSLIKTTSPLPSGVSVDANGLGM
jgi:hypothetical protein